jgi:hypothetical protein
MLTRRVFLRLLSAGAAASMLPAWGCGDNAAPFTPVFFTQHEWDTIDAATQVILPPAAAGIGASQAVAVRYIDRLLAAFDVTPPVIFAGGPASGRQANPDAHGQPTQDFPPDDMATFLPLSRVRELAWRMRVFGSAATTGGAFNDAVLGPTIGWRDLYPAAVIALDAAAAAITKGAQFVDLAAADQIQALAVVGSANPVFERALTEHTLEGTFAVPEYGGNVDLAGWKLARYDGDSFPLGHSFYDASIDAYVDRADEPTSTASPNAKPETFDDDVINALTIAAVGSGGMKFF